jgi:hypothetical protein
LLKSSLDYITRGARKQLTRFLKNNNIKYTLRAPLVAPYYIHLISRYLIVHISDGQIAIKAKLNTVHITVLIGKENNKNKTV